MVYRVAVVGAGIIGMSTAFHIASSLANVNVTVIAEHFTPNTTGDGSAGLCLPFILGNCTSKETQSWFEDTFQLLKGFHATNLAGQIGINLTYGFVLSSQPHEMPTWKDLVFGCRPMTAAELDIYKTSYGITFGTFITDIVKFLPFLTKRFQLIGGQLQEKKVERLEELANDYDIVINCTGVWARFLTQDDDLHPIRGQVLRVMAPWIKTFIVEDENHYIIPNSDNVVIGGTHQKENWDIAVNLDDRNYILDRCYQLVPSLSQATVIKEWVGLRPGRTSVRLEREDLNVGTRVLTIIHNYGHGGSGATLFWGCAKQAAKLVAECLNIPQKKS